MNEFTEIKEHVLNTEAVKKKKDDGLKKITDMDLSEKCYIELVTLRQQISSEIDRMLKEREFFENGIDDAISSLGDIDDINKALQDINDADETMKSSDKKPTVLPDKTDELKTEFAEMAAEVDESVAMLRDFNSRIDAAVEYRYADIDVNQTSFVTKEMTIYLQGIIDKFTSGEFDIAPNYIKRFKKELDAYETRTSMGRFMSTIEQGHVIKSLWKEYASNQKRSMKDSAKYLCEAFKAVDILIFKAFIISTHPDKGAVELPLQLMLYHIGKQIHFRSENGEAVYARMVILNVLDIANGHYDMGDENELMNIVYKMLAKYDAAIKSSGKYEDKIRNDMAALEDESYNSAVSFMAEFRAIKPEE